MNSSASTVPTTTYAMPLACTRRRRGGLTSGRPVRPALSVVSGVSGLEEFDASIAHSVQNSADEPAILLRRMTDGGASAHMPDAFSA